MPPWTILLPIQNKRPLFILQALKMPVSVCVSRYFYIVVCSLASRVQTLLFFMFCSLRQTVRTPAAWRVFVCRWKLAASIFQNVCVFYSCECGAPDRRRAGGNSNSARTKMRVEFEPRCNRRAKQPLFYHRPNRRNWDRIRLAHFQVFTWTTHKTIFTIRWANDTNLARKVVCGLGCVALFANLLLFSSFKSEIDDKWRIEMDSDAGGCWKRMFEANFVRRENRRCNAFDRRKATCIWIYEQLKRVWRRSGGVWKRGWPSIAHISSIKNSCANSVIT